MRTKFRDSGSLILAIGFACTLLTESVASPLPSPDSPAFFEPLPVSLYPSKERGLNGPDESSRTLRISAGEKSSPPLRILAILVDFSDKPAVTSGAFFDNLVFGAGSISSPTVRHFWNAASNTRIDLAIPSNMPGTIGWKRAPRPYSYYVNGQHGAGSYPQNSQGLLEDVINLVDPSINFSQYDGDGDGYVDGILLIHSGTGAEHSGYSTDMWSHKFIANGTLIKDGKRILSYVVTPEYWNSSGDMTIGVMAHELGHVLGLPDLYDIDGTSLGIGNWSLMAGGSWNGNLGDHPSYLDAWSKTQIGIAPQVVTSTLMNQSFPSVAAGGPIYRMNTAVSSEYFLVENRASVGYDAWLPGNGVLIWHIDNTQSGNWDEWFPGHTYFGNYQVALEQADSHFDLERRSNRGDSGDPFPGSTGNLRFGPETAPNSNSYSGSPNGISIGNIQFANGIATANLLSQPIQGIVNPATGTQVSGSFVLRAAFSSPAQFRLSIGPQDQVYSYFTAQSFDPALGAYVGQITTDSKRFPNGLLPIRLDRLSGGTYVAMQSIQVNVNNFNSSIPVPSVPLASASTMLSFQPSFRYFRQLSWNSDPSARGYRIWTQDGTELALIYDAVTSYQVATASPLSSACYFVTAYNTSGWSQSSTWTCASPIAAPPTPTGLVMYSAQSSSNGSSEAYLRWTQDMNLTASSTLEFRHITVPNYSQGPTVEGDVWYGAIGGLIANNTYCFRVRASNIAGISTFTNETCATLPRTPPCNPYKQICPWAETAQPGSPER